MRVDAFHNWRRELESVEQEMNSLMAEGVPASSEERQVRRTRFAALIERREAAARNLLRSDVPLRRGKSPAPTPGPGDLVIAAAQAGVGSEGQADAFVSLPEGARKAEVQPEGATARPVAPTDNATPDLDAAVGRPDSAAAVVDPAHPAEPLVAPESAVVADPGHLAAEIAAPVPDADVLVLDFAAPNPTADAPAVDAAAAPAEPQADLIAVASDSAALASGSDAVAPSVASEDAAAPAAEIVAVAFDAEPLGSDTAAEPATDVVALAPDAAVPATSSADESPADESSADESPADESSAESAAPFDHPVGDLGATHPSGVVAGPAEAASVVIAVEPQPAPPEDPQSEALLLKLLRRLQLGAGAKRI